MSTKANYKMIELARLSRGYTQKDLSSALPKITQSTLSKIEKGQLPFSQTTLENISKVLNYPISFFYQEELKTPISNIYFRKRTTIAQKSLDRIYSDVKIILKGIDDLLLEVELKEYRKYSFDITNGWTPGTVATRVREIMKIPFGPVKNLIKAIEEEGIIVYQYNSLEDKFDGLTAYSDNGVPVIFINKNMPNDRIRYTITHEVGHLVMHIPCDVEPWRDAEDEANLFASEFLMPKRDCVIDLKSLTFNKLTILKAYWGVSKAAIIRRAKTIGTIDEPTYKYMMVELGRRNERKIETGYVDIDESQILNEVINLLKTKREYNEQSIATSMNLNTDDFVRYFENQDQFKVKLRAIKRAI
jgi:Zn-dependent peptidase ImmA (M78 family)/DNA-binding XRE family transcriptional regulator